MRPSTRRKLEVTSLTGPVAAFSLLCFFAASAPASAQTVATGYEGWFVKGELGGNLLASDLGYWWGPGGPPPDPRITFSLNDAISLSGSVGAGYDWGNGVRVDNTIGFLTNMQVDGTFLSASDGTTLGHATDIHAPVSALTFFGNIYIEPLRLAGSDSAFQPFLTGGIGVASVSVGEWTRNNPSSPQPTRSWGGNSQLNFAWQAGGGVSIALDELMGGGGFVDLTYRYTDLGQATGGTMPVNPPPDNSPTEPFNFHLASHAVTVGLRVPIVP
jgi:opacity protein-like surface antigen